jgi:Flp pilus assembly protein TadB
VELAAALGVIAFAIMVAIQVQQGRAMRDELANVASVILREQQQLGHRVSSAHIMAEHAAARAERAEEAARSGVVVVMGHHERGPRGT